MREQGVYESNGLSIIKSRIVPVVLFIITIIIAFIFFSLRAKADTTRDTYTYYTSYEIQAGDTLWTIADKFMTPEDSDKSDFIEQIKRNNHMLDDDIREGDYLVIEYTCAR